MLRMFPLHMIQPRVPIPEEPEGEVDARHRHIQKTCLVLKDSPEGQGEPRLSQSAAGKRPARGNPSHSLPPPSIRHVRKFYPLDHYRREEDLPETALAFYSRAGKTGP